MSIRNRITALVDRVVNGPAIDGPCNVPVTANPELLELHIAIITGQPNTMQWNGAVDAMGVQDQLLFVLGCLTDARLATELSLSQCSAAGLDLDLIRRLSDQFAALQDATSATVNALRETVPPLSA